MNPSQIAGYKKFIFVHDYRKHAATFPHPFVVSFRECSRLGIVCRFLKTIALEMQMSVDCLVELLTKWYFHLNHKKLGLILYS